MFSDKVLYLLFLAVFNFQLYFNIYEAIIISICKRTKTGDNVGIHENI